MKVEIKKEIYNILEQRVKDLREFSNVEEYVNYILKEVASKITSNDQSSNEEKLVKKRLQDLGYLD